MRTYTNTNALIAVGIILMSSVILFGFLTPVENSEAIEEEVIYENEIVNLEIAFEPTPMPNPTPEPTKAPVIETHNYEWDDETVDTFAAMYWSMCNTKEEKLAMTQLVFNRSVYGSPFPCSVLECLKAKGEFTLGRVSDRNRKIARENLDKCKSQLNGHFSGVDVPSNAIYMSRNNEGRMILLDKNMNTVWRGSLN